MNHLYYNDHWTLEDDLGIAGTGDLLARMALEVEPPFSVRVTGKWGSGKTSVLRRAFVTLKGQPVQQAVPLAQDNMKEQGNEEWEKWFCDKSDRQPSLKWPDDLYTTAEKSLCVWYSPWQHQGTDNPLIPLLLEIQAQFSNRIRLKENLKDINRRGGLAAVALLERVIDAAVSLKFGKNIKMVQGTSDAVRKAWREAEPQLTELSDGQRFHLLFDDAIKNALMSLPEDENMSEKSDKSDMSEKSRLIVFIDDLDRCEESVIVDLLESVKLYLGSPHCVFVLGVDDTAVLGAF